MQKRLNKENWLELGLEALAADGPDGLGLEAMCERAGKTRGSYYHHFDSAGDFQKQLLMWWESTYTHKLIEKIDRAGHINPKLDHLNQLVAHLDPRIERAVRHLSGRNEEAALTCRAVDETRINFLARLYSRSPRFNNDDAKMLAQIEYAAWIGFLMIAPDSPPQKMLEMYNGFLRLTARAD